MSLLRRAEYWNMSGLCACKQMLDKYRRICYTAVTSSVLFRRFILVLARCMYINHNINHNNNKNKKSFPPPYVANYHESV